MSPVELSLTRQATCSASRRAPGSAPWARCSKIPVGTNTIDTLHQFADQTDGYHPAGPLVIDSAGNVFGVTTEGGGYFGAVFEWSSAAQTFNTIAGINLASEAGSPNGGLVKDAAGDLFGTTNKGYTGAVDGDVFEVLALPSHPVVMLGVPDVEKGGVTVGPDGTLFGTGHRWRHFFRWDDLFHRARWRSIRPHHHARQF